MNRRAACTAALLALAAAPRAALAQSLPAARDAGTRIVGRIRGPGLDLPVTLDAFTAFVLVDEATSSDGAAALDALVQQRIVAVEAQRRGLSVDEPTVDRRIRDLDAGLLKSTGGKKGIEQFRSEQHLSLAEFRDKLRLAILAEQMMASDFGLAVGNGIPEEKQSLWYHDQKRAAVKREKLPPGVVADVEGHLVHGTEWGTLLYRQLPDKGQEKMREEFKGAALLLHRGRAQKIEVDAKAVDQEIAERDRQLAQMLTNEGVPAQGVGFLAAIKARGQDPDAFVNGDRFRAEITLKLLTRQQHGGDCFKAYYEAHRAEFDKSFGRKVRLASIFLEAAPKKSAKIARTWAEATDELDHMKSRILSDPSSVTATFCSQAAMHSEDKASRARGGDLGFLGPEALEARGLTNSLLDEATGSVVGPINARDGVYLLLIGEKRAASPFEEIREEVEKAARREVLVEATKDTTIELDL